MNERQKLGANFLNAVGIGVVGAAFIIPGVVDLATVRWSWFPVGIRWRSFFCNSCSRRTETMSDTLSWAVPVVSLSIGALFIGVAWYSSYRFDKKYGREP